VDTDGFGRDVDEVGGPAEGLWMVVVAIDVVLLMFE